MAKRIAINGFGRIGRTFLRTVLMHPQAMQELAIVAINVGPTCGLEHLDLLFKHDSIMGTFPGEVLLDGNALRINGQSIAIYHEKAPENLPWKSLQIDCVVDASGAFIKKEDALRHCTAGASKVIITAPACDEDISVIMGVNDQSYDRQKHQIISLGSCTTNCFAPLVKVLHEAFGITSGLMTTIHAYTNDQVILDNMHKDPRRARAAGLNMVPTKTGANKLIAKLFPELDGLINAVAIRVPTPVVSLIDFSFTAQKNISVAAINAACKEASTNALKNIMFYEEAPLVSSDFRGNEASCIVDSLLTQTSGNMGKVFAWYDNEYGYSCRIRDFLLHNF